MKTNNKLLAIIAVINLTTLMVPCANAELDVRGNFVGNLAATSTYLFRGLAQTSNAAVQGGLGYNGTSGVHFAGWTSTVDNGSELDVKLGFTNKINMFSYDAGLIFYVFPQSSGNNDEEVYLGAQLGAIGAKFSVAVDRGEYLETDFTLPIESWLMNIHAGFNRVKNGEDYLDFNLAFNKDMKDFNFGFLISDTNLSGEDFRTIVTVSKDFTL